ncbi:caspase 6 [Willisornis vidua]|uniref:Caspase 6 n=1 Tax=Willisornis vidua TaxID=1566151 RepID=A0ABQ9CTY3_9PASS|nr:caspase 6 [Willisornis vidua]
MALVLLPGPPLLLPPLLLVLAGGGAWRPARGQEAPHSPDWRMTLKTIRNGVHKIDVFLNAALDLLGGEDGLCRYKCSDGSKPIPRYKYKPSPPNGCGSPLFGVHFDIGIPSMTKCCNQHDRCYDTCNNKKNDCDEQFQSCLSKICRDVQKTLGISESVQACESAVQLLFDAVIHLGCKPYLDSQRAAYGNQNVTEVDAFDVSLTDLGFEVQVFDDLKAEEVLQKIFEASKDDHSNADCFVCVFLSHGENDHIYAYNAKIKIQTITDMFRGDKCQSLVGKPKIFIIQACRGDKHDDPVIAYDSTDTGNESTVNETEVDAAGVYTLPAGADFIMCYSVAQGYYSHRETVNGSWYIQDLCETLRNHGSSLEFTELLTVVNRKVSHRKVDMCRDMNAIGKKQIPCFASMLTKKLYFHPKSK